MLIDANNLDEAYERIRLDSLNQGCSVLLLVSPEPDSLCACKILTSLLRSDNITHKIKPASGYDDLDRFNAEFIANNEEIRSLILINCGGIVDLLEFFTLPEHTNVYVLDSHRPYHLANVRPENEKIRLLDDGDGSLDAYPDDVSEDEEAENEEEEEEEEEEQPDGSRAKRRKTEEELQKRKEKKEAIKKITEYYRGSYFGKSTAALMYKLALQLNKDSNELLWYWIVGVADQFVNEKIPREQYTWHVSECHEEVTRLNILPTEEELKQRARQQSQAVRTEDGKEQSLSWVMVIPPGHISFSYEYRMMLLRHWSLYHSMYHSRYIASRLGIWRDSGRQMLKKFFAAMGLPLEECQVSYSQMAEQYKILLKQRIEDGVLATEYGLGDIQFGSFVKQHGTTMRIVATDYVYALSALLEETSKTLDEEDDDPDKRWERNFWNAYSALSSSEQDINTLKRGLNNCIELQKAIVRQGTTMIKKKIIVPTGSFRYAVIEDSPDLELFSHPLALSKLLLFLADAMTEESRAGKRKKPEKPFVLCSYVERRGTFLCVASSGQRTVRQGLRKNVFGVAFREAADRTTARIKHDGFDTAVMEVQKDDLKHFLEVLHSGLIEL